MYLLGYDIGSSSVKAALVEIATGKTLITTQYSDEEMPIQSPRFGWAEQDPEMWWDAVVKVTHKLISLTTADLKDATAIGISYQMHGLVLVDRDKKALRPGIIWCDGRAVNIGDKAFLELGKETCLSKYLNSPGNFTASKLKWVKENEHHIYEHADKMMLPGDFIAMKMTGEIGTTVSGLSEGILWDFQENKIADQVITYYGLRPDLIPEVKETFSIQGELSADAARALRLREGTPVSYRAGDQPNNAFSLGVIHDGEVAATGGTSGVIYAVTNKPLYDKDSRVNGFAHVNHCKEDPRIGVLLCINGAGILYSWMKNNICNGQINYQQMESLAAEVKIGSEKLSILPFGNGPERILRNTSPGVHIANLQLTTHRLSHLLRASLEGIAFSYVYGFKIMKEMGVSSQVIRVGNDNLFQSSVFSRTVSTLLNKTIEVRDTTGAIGAARGAGLGAGIYEGIDQTINQDEIVQVYTPEEKREVYEEAYYQWEAHLNYILQNNKASY